MTTTAANLQVGDYLDIPGYEAQITNIAAIASSANSTLTVNTSWEKGGLKADDGSSALAAAAVKTVLVERERDEATHTNSSQVCPKADILQAGFDATAKKSFVEINEPLSVSMGCMQHGWYCPGADHQLFLTVNSNWEKDLFVETRTKSFSTLASAANIKHATDRAQYQNCVNAGDNFGLESLYAVEDTGYIVTRVASVELHVGYVGSIVPFVPKSVSWAWSSIDVHTRPISSATVRESIVIEPSVRMVIVAMRQDKHGTHCDREELGKAGAKLVERDFSESFADAVNSNNATQQFNTLVVRCGNQSAPTPVYGDMDVTKCQNSRAFTDMLQAIGKPLALRGGVQSFTDYCGRFSANLVNSEIDKAGGGGDRGPLYFMRLLLPPGSLQNVLTIDATLESAPQAGAKQQLVVACISDQLWNMKYAPPNELPLSTTSRALV
eukprot:COSAG05_NODE_353_length_10881_cov_72.725839_5_plen_439_part_00